MLTADILFLPISIIFFYLIIAGHLAAPLDWGAGIVLGIALNYLGILKMIDLLKRENSIFVFPKRFMPPQSNKKGN